MKRFLFSFALAIAPALSSAGEALPRDWLIGDFRAENGTKARHRLLELPALGELVFLEWRDGEDRPLRRRLLRIGQGQAHIILFRDAAAFAELDRRPILIAALTASDLRFLPEPCAMTVEPRERSYALVLEEGRCEFEEEGQKIALASEWLVSADGFEFKETAKRGEGAVIDRLPAEGRLIFRRLGTTNRANDSG